jgi:hypothetical protein
MSYVTFLKENGVLNAQGAKSVAETEFFCILNQQKIQRGSIRECIDTCDSMKHCPYFGYWYKRIAGGNRYEDSERSV